MLVADDAQNISGTQSYTFLEHIAESDLENFCLVVISNEKNDIDIVGRHSNNGCSIISGDDLAFDTGEILSMFEKYGISSSAATPRGALQNGRLAAGRSPHRLTAQRKTRYTVWPTSIDLHL